MNDDWRVLTAQIGIHRDGVVKNFCTGHIHKQQINDGYKRVKFDGKNHLVHRLLAKSFIPNPEHKPCVDHINGDSLDNRLEKRKKIPSRYIY